MQHKCNIVLECQTFSVNLTLKCPDTSIFLSPSPTAQQLLTPPPRSIVASMLGSDRAGGGDAEQLTPEAFQGARRGWTCIAGAVRRGRTGGKSTGERDWMRLEKERAMITSRKEPLLILLVQMLCPIMCDLSIPVSELFASTGSSAFSVHIRSMPADSVIRIGWIRAEGGFEDGWGFHASECYGRVLSLDVWSKGGGAIPIGIQPVPSQKVLGACKPT